MEDKVKDLAPLNERVKDAVAHLSEMVNELESLVARKEASFFGEFPKNETMKNESEDLDSLEDNHKILVNTRVRLDAIYTVINRF